MRPRSFLPCLGLLLLALPLERSLSAHEARYFQEPVRLRAGDGFVEVNVGFACPTVFDLNRDGAPDLVVGEYEEGQVRVFLNQSHNGAPAYAPNEYLMIRGERFTVPMG